MMKKYHVIYLRHSDDALRIMSFKHKEGADDMIAILKDRKYKEVIHIEGRLIQTLSLVEALNVN